MMHAVCNVCHGHRENMTPAEHAVFLAEHVECATFAAIVADYERAEL